MAKILLVDDDAGVRAVFEEALTLNGHVVTSADNGHEAKEFLGVNTYDVIVVDLMMPKYDGLTLITWLKNFSKTPIIVMSGHSDSMEAQKAKTMGVSNFLVKPFGPEILLKAVAKVISKI